MSFHEKDTEGERGMRRRLTAALLALCLVLTLLPTTVLAAETVSTGKCGKNVTWTLDSDGVLTIRGTGPMGNLNDTDPSYTWYDKGRVKSVVIEKGVTSIGYMVFEGCGSLTNVTIPDSVTSIGIHAFSSCVGLAGVTIPGSVTSIGSRAFYNCANLTSATIPDGVRSIGTEAFRECVRLTGVTIPGSLSNIGDQTFYGCTGLTDVTILDGVRSVGTEAFFGCGSLAGVVIPDSVTSIRERAFLECSSLASMTIPNNVTSIGERAFSGCGSLTSVTIPGSLTNIESSVFYGCSGLTSVTIQSGVESIGEEAFRGCSSLTSLTIPDSVTGIGASAFSGCSGLTGVMIPNSVTGIGNAAFSNCTKLASVAIPDSVTGIGTSVFNECYGLTSVGIPSSVTNIGDYAFYRCTGLRDVYYGGSEERWGQIAIGTYNDSLGKATKHYLSQMPESFTVVFNSQGGSPVGSQIVIGGKKLAKPNPNPTRTGYTFGGWYKEESCTNPWGFFEDKVTENITLYAKWTRNLHTVRYVWSDGGSITTYYEQTVTDNSKATAPNPAPQRPGYTFMGWYTDQTYTRKWDFNADTVKRNTTLYAYWTPVFCTVTFDLNGGDDPAAAFPDQTVPYGGKAEAPAVDPTRTGHTFGGWYREAACTNRWNFGTGIVTGNITLYAKWTEDAPPLPTAYTITFRANGGIFLTGGNEVTAETGEDGCLAHVPVPTREGYTLDAWYTEATGGTAIPVTSSYVFQGNATLYAHWMPIPCTVAFDLNGGDDPAAAFPDQTVPYGGKAEAPAVDPTRTGHTFGGWYREAACTNRWNFDTDIVTGDITLYAKWTRNGGGADPDDPGRFTVTFAPNGGTGGGALTTGTDGKLAALPENPARRGYTFDGWYTEAAGGTKISVTTDYVFRENITLYAHWMPIPCTVAFDLNGGDDPAAAFPDQTVPYGGKAEAPAVDPTRTGHTFGGWYREAACTNRWNFDTDIVTGDITLYAKWTRNGGGADPDDPGRFTVTFAPNGGTGGGALTTGTDGKLAALPANPVRPGYTFDGWFTQPSGGTAVTTATVFTADATVYARWTQNGGGADPDDPGRFTVTFAPNGGTGGGALTTGTDGKLAALPANPVRPGYTFDGWFTQPSGGTAVTTATVFTADATVYARWTPAAASM